MAIDIQKIRGFNYAPGYAYTGADIWRSFDRATFERELGWGSKHFSEDERHPTLARVGGLRARV